MIRMDHTDHMDHYDSLYKKKVAAIKGSHFFAFMMYCQKPRWISQSAAISAHIEVWGTSGVSSFPL